MSIAVADARTVTEETLRGLLGLPETETLDYKRDAYGRSDADKREFCKDVSGLANTRGGDLVLGMEEKDHVASALVGLQGVNVKDEIQHLQQLVLTAIEPRLVGVVFHEVGLANGASALVIRVPQSMDLPHRVSQNNSNRFFVRHTTDTVEASLLELRRMFELAGSEFDNAERLRLERANRLEQNREPCLLSGKNEGYYALHIIPFGYSRQSGWLCHVAKRVTQKGCVS
jgi:predicted HTH transcriptional regulator